MKKTAVIALSLVILILSMLVSSAYAKTPIAVNGSRNLIGKAEVLDEKPAGESDNIILHLLATHSWTGNIEGIASRTSYATRIFHDFPTGRVNLHTIETLSSVKVFGEPKSGELTIRLEAIIDGGNIEGQWVIISGTDDLSTLHGQGTLSGPQRTATYSGQVHFDP